MKLFTILVAALLLSSFSLLGQVSWQEMIQDPNANFYDIQNAFNNDLGNAPYEKGKGIKQFRRWEYYWQGRVDEKGNFPAPGIVSEEMTNYYNSHPDSRNYLAGSGNWSLLGPIDKPANGTGQPNGNGRILSIAFHPTDYGTIYAGAPAGGFWKSLDNGTTWTEYNAGLTRLGISSIIIHPINPNIMYIGTGDRDGGDSPGYGVWQSVDGGLTWAAHNNGMGNLTVNDMVINPNNPDIIIAATNIGMFRTTDGGDNWALAFIGHNCKDIDIHPTNPNIVYAAGGNFYRSTDGGATWSQISTGLPTPVSRMDIAVSANQPNYVYIFAGGATGYGSFEGVYRSTDSGASFSTRSTTPNIMGYSTVGSDNSHQAWYDIALAADPYNANVLYAGSVNIWKSVDGGATWNLTAHWVGSGGADDVHADHHVLEFSPHTNYLYNGNDGGVYFTADAGASWNEISGGLYIAQVYKIGVSQQTPDLVINGYQDNGTAISRGTDFITEIGGDGMECAIDPSDDNYMYGALYYGNISRSTNGGISFFTIAANGFNGLNETGAWVTPYKLDPSNPARMYIGYDNIWRANDVKTPTSNAISWVKISNFTSNNNIRDLAIANSDNDVMYVARDRSGERFFVTTNATAATPTWTNISASLPINATPKDIEIDPNNPSHLFIAIGNDIYESTNSGGSWSNVSGTLPNISLNTIVIDYNSPVTAMYVGMDVGIYYKDNSLSDWVIFSTGLPNTEVAELEIYYNEDACSSTLYAATYGQGLWKSDLKDPDNVSAIACFDASATTVCIGEALTLTDHSSYTPTTWNWTISPSTYNFVGGTNANSQNPQVSFSAPGTYTIQLQAGNNAGSDTEIKNALITVSMATPASAFNENFESYSTCSTTADCGSGTCNMTGGLWKNKSNGTDDNIDWRIHSGNTPSANTGPTADFIPGSSTGKYAYLEASGGCNQQTALLESACMTLDQDYNFELHYHMFGENMGSFHLDINIGGVWTLDIAPAIFGNQGSNWHNMTVNLASYTGQTIKLRIRGVTGNDHDSDMAIDAIRLVPTAVILPIELTTISANCGKNGYNTINWSFNNIDFSGNFEVQKLNMERMEWNSIGKVPFEGYTNMEFVDVNPSFGENLYRLAINEEEGTTEYSQMTVANCDELDAFSFKVFPNPFAEKVTVQFTSEMTAKCDYVITNLIGQNLRTGTFSTNPGLNSFDLPIQELPVGVYLLHIEGRKMKLVKTK